LYCPFIIRFDRGQADEDTGAFFDAGAEDIRNRAGASSGDRRSPGGGEFLRPDVNELAVGHHLQLLVFWLFFEWLLNVILPVGCRDLAGIFLFQKPINMSPFLKRVLWTGLIAGFLDILSAYIHVFVKTHQISRKMFNYIAGGAIGLKNSMSGGAGRLRWGCLSTFLMPFYLRCSFFSSIAEPDYSLLTICYGPDLWLFTWFVMNVIVLPLSQLPHRPFDVGSAALEGGILVVAIGLPLSLSARAFFSGGGQGGRGALHGLGERNDRRKRGIFKSSPNQTNMRIVLFCFFVPCADRVWSIA